MDLPENRPITAAFLILVGSFIACLAYIGWFWPVLDLSTRVSVATATLGVLGTLFLAVATFWTVHQNRRLIDERMREREKPIAREELNEFIEPSIAIVESNINAIKEAKGLEWVNTSPRRIFDIGGRTAILETEIQLVFAPADPFLRERMSGEAPDLFDTVENHNQMVERFSELRHEAIQEIEEQVREFLRENSYEDEFQEDEIEILLDAILKRSENYADHQEFWDSARDELLMLAHNSASHTFDELEQETERYFSTCESLQNHLNSRKTELKRNYSIISEFDPDEDFINVV